MIGLPSISWPWADACAPAICRPCCSVPTILRGRCANALRLPADAKHFVHYRYHGIGLGGGAEVFAHNGCHLRDSDLLVEILDPETGSVLPGGQTGEVVLTTIGRKGMPLLRYPHRGYGLARSFDLRLRWSELTSGRALQAG